MATIQEDWKRDYLYRMFSHHTRDKEKENYVVNAIWARLDDLNIKPVTQQYVRRTNGYALIDLYFPQINYGIECDEAYHQDNTLRDSEREIDLMSVLSSCSEDGLVIRRVDATQSVEALHDRIREIVNEIRSLVAKQGGRLEPWLSPDERWAQFKERGSLCVEDVFSFEKIADICEKCFGKPKDYKIQRCFFKVGDNTMLWCPKLAIKQPDGTAKAQSRGWVNELSEDWSVITEYNEKTSGEVRYPQRPRITFAKSKNERGENAYRFIGIFLFSENVDGKRIYRSIATTLPLQ